MRVLSFLVVLAVMLAGAAPAAARPAQSGVQAESKSVRPFAAFSTAGGRRVARGLLRAGGEPPARAYLRFDLSDVAGPIRRGVLRVSVGGSRGRAGLVATTRDGTVLDSQGPNSGRTMSLTVTEAAIAGTEVEIVLRRRGGPLSLHSRGWRRPRLVLTFGDPPGRRTDEFPAPPPGAVVVAAAGDVACSPRASGFNNGVGTPSTCRQLATSDLMLAHRLDAVLVPGDTQYETGAWTDFQASYDPSWGRLKSITYPATGNHEYLTPGAAGYFDYFGPAAGRRDEGWYSFDLGSWHVIALNSSCDHIGGCGPNSPQTVWLREDLADNEERCTLAFWHHPRFTSGPTRTGQTDFEFMSDLYRVLDEEGADLVVAGHQHNYERFERMNADGVPDPNGMRSFVVGTGGRSLHQATGRRTGSQAYSHDSFGFLRLVLRRDGYDWDFVPESAEGFRDSGSDNCG